MIYTEDPRDDLIAVLDFINSFAESIGHKPVRVDTNKCWSAIKGARDKFPYVNGLDEASAFKKAANFVAWFVGESPIERPFETTNLSNYNPNAVIAFDIAIYMLEQSSIHGTDGATRTISSPITVSDHSYYDILGALSQGITPQSHFELLAVFFEQLTYKTNPDCQYKTECSYYPDLMDEEDEI
ncbi:MAG: hypothetical protein RPU60_01705 [Candidatus Sedimenticola sp. (ex Thyasira tokunagai)]